jgi:hypothetical protein
MLYWMAAWMLGHGTLGNPACAFPPPFRRNAMVILTPFPLTSDPAWDLVVSCLDQNAAVVEELATPTMITLFSRGKKNLQKFLKRNEEPAIM